MKKTVDLKYAEKYFEQHAMQWIRPYLNSFRGRISTTKYGAWQEFESEADMIESAAGRRSSVIR